MNALVFAYRKPFSQEALLFAKLLAAQAGCAVSLLYISKRESGTGRGEAAIEHALKQLEGVKVQNSVKVGNPIRIVEAHRNEKDIDMLVVGSLVRAGLIGERKQAALLRIVSQADVSTMVVRSAPRKIERILVCTAGSKPGHVVVEQGARLAKALKVSATLLHVGGSVPSMYTGLAEVEEELSELLETNTPLAQSLRRGAEILDEHGVDGEVELRRGVVAEQILREADEGSFDLIVIGASRSGSNLHGLLMGNVTQEIISGASIPVFIVK